MTLLADPAFPRVAWHLERMGVGALTLFRAPCLERRLGARLRARGRDLAGYARLLDADSEERARLVSALAVGVTSFFRNPTAWRALGAVLDQLGPLEGYRVWSAGCATGEEAYSVAMLLAGTGRRHGEPPIRFSVEATDLDRRSLERAALGRYSSEVVRAIEAVGPPRGEIVDDRFEVDPQLRTRVQFKWEDLTTPLSRGPYHLVICRNVLIYFGAKGQARALDTLISSVAPGGLLLLGRTELAASEAPGGLVAVDAHQRLFRRAA